MFKFLKLRNSDSGDARRHVPFRSIIHKPLFLIFAFLFSFVCIVPVKVSAAAPNLTPEFEPIYDTDITNFQDSYLNLDPAAQAAASILFGAYLFEYAGLADFGTVFQSAPTDGDVWDRLEFAGQQFIDLFFLPVNAADQLVLTPLIELGQGIINKVKGVSDVEDFKSDILDVSEYGLRYTPDIGFSINQALARQGGLYNWQQSSSGISFPFSFFQYPMSGYMQTQYFNNTQQLSPLPPIRGNWRTNEYSDLLFASELFTRYKYFFVNTTSNTAYLCDENGTAAPYSVPGSWVYYNYSADVTSYSPLYYYPAILSLNNYNTLYDLYNAILTNTGILIGFQRYDFHEVYFDLSFIDDFYIGNSWENKSEWVLNTDLGFANTNELQYLNPIKDAIFDLKQLVQQIVQAQPDPNYELPLQPIIYNITQVEGSPLTAEDLQGISFNVTPPESGIDVPANVFLPFFDDGKGFISYMWYMTKPLVSYTRSFLDAITFDPVDGFNASGPGYFILGVAALGLIGGVIVKFLL